MIFPTLMMTLTPEIYDPKVQFDREKKSKPLILEIKLRKIHSRP